MDVPLSCDALTWRGHAGLRRGAEDERPRPGNVPRRGRFSVHRGFGCAAHFRKSWRAHHAHHRVPHVGRGAHEASLGASGTADGWERGRGPSAFFLERQNQLGSSSSLREAGPVCDGEALSPAVFAARSSRVAATPPPNCGGGVVLRSLLLSWFFSGTPLSSGAPRDLPSRLHLMRDLVNPAPRMTAAETRRPLALRGFARSRIRCSWRRTPKRLRQVLPPVGDGDEPERSHQPFSWPRPHLLLIPPLDFVCSGFP
jgi:hypothetical protein